MQFQSPAFNNFGLIPAIYTADGDNVNPPLSISGVLPGVKSLALSIIDQDAPGGFWVHWLVWDIAPTTTNIPANSVPEGAWQGFNDFGTEGYAGPNPPAGAHRYVFTLYALNTILESKLSPVTPADIIIKTYEAAEIDSCTITGLYSHT